jgi:hypothetical protein
MQIREGFSIGDVIKQLRELDQAAEDLGGDQVFPRSCHPSTEDLKVVDR